MPIVGQKIKEELEFENEELDKNVDIKFEDLPKRFQKKIMRGDYRSCSPVEPKNFETGTFAIMKIIKENPGISRIKIVDTLKLSKKKVKRILKQNTLIVNRVFQKNETKYYYVGDKLL